MVLTPFAFSADGSLIAYVSGEPTLTHASSGIQYFRIEGTLWLADVAHPEQARAIETGAFATSECPLPSPSGRKFAYFVQKAPDAWELHVYRDGGVSTVADDPDTFRASASVRAISSDRPWRRVRI